MTRARKVGARSDRSDVGRKPMKIRAISEFTVGKRWSRVSACFIHKPRDDPEPTALCTALSFALPRWVNSASVAPPGSGYRHLHPYNGTEAEHLDWISSNPPITQTRSRQIWASLCAQANSAPGHSREFGASAMGIALFVGYRRCASVQLKKFKGFQLTGSRISMQCCLPKEEFLFV